MLDEGSIFSKLIVKDASGLYLPGKDWLNPLVVDIRQILIETYNINKLRTYVTASEFFDQFLDQGFVPFSKEANTHPKAKPAGQLFEWGFVRLHLDFLRRSGANIAL